MSFRSRVAQDRRLASRISVRFNCHVTYAGVSHEVVLLDISLKGALLSSRFLPSKHSIVTVNLQTSLLTKALTLDGKVVRSDSGTSEHGQVYKFGIQFTHTPLALVELLNKIIAQQSRV